MGLHLFLILITSYKSNLPLEIDPKLRCELNIKVKGSHVGIIILKILVWKLRKSPRESKSHSQKSKGHLGMLNIIMGLYCYVAACKSCLLKVSFGRLYKSVP